MEVTDMTAVTSAVLFRSESKGTPMNPYFQPIFVDFQNEAASLCVNNSVEKDLM